RQRSLLRRAHPGNRAARRRPRRVRANARAGGGVARARSAPGADRPDRGLRLRAALRGARRCPPARARLHDACAGPADAALARAVRSRRDERDPHPGAAAPAEGRSHRMTPQEFVAQLDAENQRRLGLLAPADTLKPEVEGDLNVVNLLKVALRNEIEATEIAARWLVTTDDVDVKLALARQVGDEAKHYRMIAERLRALGFDAKSFDPLAKGYGPLFQYLDTLTSTVERVAAGQFTREAIAVVKNRQFIEFCDHAGDRETAAMYRDVIEPDERYHHELGRTLLLRLATTPDAQAAASRAARQTLELADELQKKALATAGIHHAPGC